VSIVSNLMFYFLFFFFIKNSFPLQESLKLPQTFVRKQNEISLLLPEPLFILYKQAIGYQEAYGIYYNMNTIS